MAQDDAVVQPLKKKFRAGMNSECDTCMYSEDCPKAFVSATCALVKHKEVSLDSPSDVLEVQKTILKGAVKTLARAEVLARMGVVSFSDVDRVRRMVLEFSEKLKKSMGEKKNNSSASSRLGLNGTGKAR